MGFLGSLFGGSSSNSAPQTNKNKSIGHALLGKYKPFITSKETAKKAALTVLWAGKTQFIYGPDGGMIRGADSGVALPPRLQSFSDRFYDEGGMIVNQQVAGLTESLVRAIDDGVIQIETIYSIAGAIVEKYDL